MRTVPLRIGSSLGVLAVALAGCGDLTAPPPPPATVAGSWSYAATDLAGSFLGNPVGCDYELSMSITSAGVAFSGTYRRAQLVCDLFGMPQLVDAGGGSVVSGSRDGDAVQFDFDSESIRNNGTLTGDRMSGEVVIQLVIQFNEQIDTILVTGPWSATR